MELNDKNFEEEVIKSDIPVLVDFWASWCPPCKMMEPVINQIAKEYEGKAKVLKLNVDRNKLTAAKYEIRGVPTFIMFKNGETIERVVSAQTVSNIKKMIEKGFE